MTTTELYRKLLLCYSFRPYECIVDYEDIQGNVRSSYRIVNDIALNNLKLQLFAKDIVSKLSVNRRGITSTTLFQRLTKNIGVFDYNIQNVVCSITNSCDIYPISEIKLVSFFNKEALCFVINRDFNNCGRNRI